MSIPKKICLTLMPLAVVITCAAFWVAQSRANSQSENPSEGRVTSYRIPTGPELDPLVTAKSAAEKYARAAGQSGELKIKIARGAFAQAAAVTEEKKPSEAEKGITSPDIAEWRASPAYLVVIESGAPDAKFSPDVRTPPGREGPSGKVMSLILEAHTGFLEGRTLGPTAPKLSELGPVITATFAPSAEESPTTDPVDSNMAHSARVRLGSTGRLTGRVYAGKRPVAGWHVLIGRKGLSLGGKNTVAGKTGKGGIFSFRVLGGTYRVAARRPNGSVCGTRTTHIVARRETYVTVRCNK